MINAIHTRILLPVPLKISPGTLSQHSRWNINVIIDAPIITSSHGGDQG